MKKDSYFIIFADPKGMKHTDWTHKVDGYKQLFEENGKEKIFKHDGLNDRIKLLLRTDDITKAPDEYRRFWFDGPSKMLDVAK
jgi:type III restriction enzyme